MKRPSPRPRHAAPLLAGLLMGLLGFLLTLRLAAAAPAHSPAAQDATPGATTLDLTGEAQDCQECHLDVAHRWAGSPHAHAFDDAVFQERWAGLGTPGECLVCHTTGFQQSTGEFVAEGVQCSACHGEASADHPPATVEIKADTEYCGVCHTTTLSEWRLTAHSTEGIGCSACHDPHSQNALFAEPDELCLNCHEGSMGDYLEDLHIQQDIGCVDCHALVIPPEHEPVDGIVPTGHAFTMTTGTCVACHTDALHAGFSLPGYEHGAAAANGQGSPDDEAAATSEAETVQVSTGLEPDMTTEQRVQTLEAALASRNTGLLFQGAVVGLVFGGSTAWLIGQNLRRRGERDEH